MKKKYLLLLLFSIILLILAFIYRFLISPIVQGDVATIGMTMQMVKNSSEMSNIEVIATNLNIPWEIAFLPDGSLLITERPGTLVHLSAGEFERLIVDGVDHRGEGGLLGLTLHPEYIANNWIYLYFSSSINGFVSNRVERYTLNLYRNRLINKKIIINKIPGAVYHDGGRIAFGPDDLLYITTGDAGNARNAQKFDSLAGKILRLSELGEIPESNPFKNEVFSYGHRNPQGLAWDKNNNLWSTDHGPSLIDTGKDEMNLTTIGGNYGWPVISGDETQVNMKQPVIQSGSETVWAPAGMAIHEDILYFAGLKGESLFSANIENNKLTNLTRHFHKELGRIRNVKVGPQEEWLYILTSNTDGRGEVKENDDKLIRVRIGSLDL